MFVSTSRELSYPPILVFIAVKNIELEFLKWRRQLSERNVVTEVKGSGQSRKAIV